MASKTRRPQNKTKRPELRPRLSYTQRVLNLPRYARTLVVFLGVMVLAFALQQLVGELYVRIFASSMALSTVSWIVAGICLSMYMAGYVFIIGTPGVTPKIGRAQTIYLWTITLLTVVSLAWIIVRVAGALAE